MPRNTTTAAKNRQQAGLLLPMKGDYQQLSLGDALTSLAQPDPGS
jgi:hypothetical protein